MFNYLEYYVCYTWVVKYGLKGVWPRNERMEKLVDVNSV